jgi:hypothetical protein
MQSGENSRCFLSSSGFKPMKRSYSVFPPIISRCQWNVEVAPVKNNARPPLPQVPLLSTSPGRIRSDVHKSVSKG